MSRAITAEVNSIASNASSPLSVANLTGYWPNADHPIAGVCGVYQGPAPLINRTGR